MGFKSRTETPTQLGESYLLSATYSGERRCVMLKLFEPKTGKIYFWYDNTGHKPYCLTNLSVDELQKIPSLLSAEGFDHFETIEKIDSLKDQPITVTKIVANDPLSIGGRPSGSIRDILPRSRPDDPNLKVWEADIKYYESFIYDRNLETGMPYRIENNNLIPVESTPSVELQQIETIFKNESKEFREYIKSWVSLLEYPVPNLRCAALDIEVESPFLDRIPDPKEAANRIICASIKTTDGVERVLLLKRSGVEEGTAELPDDLQLTYYDDEGNLVAELLKILTEYPIIITFNGDEFDLRYIWNRAQRLGFTREQIPIEMGREFALLTYGTHLDLYRLFFNRSIQVYAFDMKYRDKSLQEISTAILGYGKIDLERRISELSYSELAAYCFRDSVLTYELTAVDDNLLLKLVIALSRVSKMPLDDVIRQGVSHWIRSLMYAEHRKKGFLIPSSKEIESSKGVRATEAIIKGKKYRGGIVIEPKPGVNFNVTVLDFSSLYPSIIKRWNLSYETVLCPHEECKTNLIPGTPHWVCTKKTGLSSLLIGSLKDLRVKWYKPKAKDKALSKEVRSWYAVIQRTLKVILNASYGVFGAEHFALYCPPVAEATAAIGRYAITSTIDKAQEFGIEVIYGDTDSVFLNNPSGDQINSLVQWSRDSLGMDLDVDKIYRYSVFSTLKKNYIGVYPDGSVDIKGLVGKKRNTPKFLKESFVYLIQTLSEVKSEADFVSAKKRIKEIVRECYVNLKNKKFPLLELAFIMVLSKGLDEYNKTTPQHVKALERLSPEDTERIGAGSVISYVKIRREPGVKLVDRASIDEIDTAKYIEHIRTTFEQVLNALDIDFNDIIGIAKLDLFME
ncbi:MAG: DNA-directed DNA polymerase I [Candidatus Bathyarchaeota archaeon]